MYTKFCLVMHLGITHKMYINIISMLAISYAMPNLNNTNLPYGISYFDRIHLLPYPFSVYNKPKLSLF